MKKESNKNCGIYKITSPTRRIYIGQSVNIKSRVKAYKRLDCKMQHKLYNSLKKHGVENHTFEIIEECSIEDLNCRERYWQEFYDVLGDKGLNCELTGCNEELKVTGRNVKVYDTFFKVEYSSINEVIRKTGDTSIAQKLQGRVYNDTSFVYKEEYDNNIFKIKKERGRNYKPVIDITTYVVFKNINEASEIYNINKSTLRDYLDNTFQNKTNLRYLTPNKKGVENIKARKKIIDTENGIVYNSITEASKIIGINRCSLGGYLSGKTPNKTTLRYLEEEQW